jgi:hypothetical protein
MATRIQPSHALFSSYSDLQNFFMQSDAPKEVLRKKDSAYSKPLLPINPQLSAKWQLCQIATAPIRLTLELALRIFSFIASCVGATHIAKRAKMSARYQSAGFIIYSDESTKLFKIKTTHNRPNARGKIVTKIPFLPKSQIYAPKVERKTFASIQNGVKFDHQNGICRGMSFWFLYLYLKTQSQFSDSRSHMNALGKQFSKGGDIEPTLLQSINLRKGKLLNINIGKEAPYQHRKYSQPEGLFTYSTTEWASNVQNIAEQLQNMPKGAFKLCIPRHAMAYVKIDARQSFFFDPNQGIIEINGDNQGQKLHELITNTLVPSNDIRSSFNAIAITPVALRQKPIVMNELG